MTAFLADGFARYDVVHCGAYIYYPVDGTCVDGGQAFSVDDALEYKKDDVRYRRLSAAAFMVADFLVCLLKLFAVSGGGLRDLGVLPLRHGAPDRFRIPLVRGHGDWRRGLCRHCPWPYILAVENIENIRIFPIWIVPAGAENSGPS